MAGLAVDASLGRLDPVAGPQLEGAGRVTPKATQRGSHRLESTIEAIIGIDVPWRNTHRLSFGVKALPMLDICVFIKLAHVGNRLCAGSESPLPNTSFRRGCQRVRMTRLRLFVELTEMTHLARLMTNILARQDVRKQKRQERDG